MKAFHSIQNATINTIAGFQAGLVAGATNARRSYLRPECSTEVRPDSMHPEVGDGSHSLPGGIGGLKRDHLLDANLADRGTMSGRTPTGRTWRIDGRHLPDTAWAMLVISRTMCG